MKINKKYDIISIVGGINTMDDNLSVLKKYGENFTEKKYVTDPAIGRNEEIKQLIMILLTPDKSGILVGKPGIGKTAIVEGLGYRIMNSSVPNALLGYTIIKLNTASLMGTMPGSNETKIQVLLSEIKASKKLILFIDEIHTLIGTNAQGSIDFANIFKPGLDRGNIKMIGATTTEEYERYVLKDKAFVRRFQKVDVAEPTREQNVQILMGTLPKIEKSTGVKMPYSTFTKEKIMKFLTDITTEYRRIYEIGSRYPDVTLALLSQAFSNAVFDNRDYITIKDVYSAIERSKSIYPDVIKKELVHFESVFADIYQEETSSILNNGSDVL